jgi:hypothetical protein
LEGSSGGGSTGRHDDEIAKGRFEEEVNKKPSPAIEDLDSKAKDDLLEGRMDRFARRSKQEGGLGCIERSHAGNC